MTTDQITDRGATISVRFGPDEINLPDKLGRATLDLARTGRAYTGVGSPANQWLFPGLLPGKPITAVRWMHEAGTDWNRYAAELAWDNDPQP